MIITCTAVLFCTCASAQMPDSATQMKNWIDYMTPGKEHKMMSSWSGTWNASVTMWMAPGAPPMISNGTVTNSMILGGRYQQSIHKSSFNGMPFEGVSTLAFDKAKKVFIFTWLDNMGTGIMSGQGPWDEATQSFTMTGKMVEPTTGTDMNFREVFRIIDKDHQMFDMYSAAPDGKEFKTMSVSYTRKK